MKIVLATGIYPPAIGGPATYVKNLADQLVQQGHVVQVLTYGQMTNDTMHNDHCMINNQWDVHRVSHSIPLFRWWRYSRKLREVAADADVIYAFSSVSCGVPLILSGLRGPRRVLRLGGDFFWERYTDWGGRKGLREWYESGIVARLLGCYVARLLRQFDHIVFSTRFQEELYEKHFRKLPPHSVIENALERNETERKAEARNSKLETRNSTHKTDFRLLFLGRFVAFKNLPALVDAVAGLKNCTLTLTGSGPQESRLRAQVRRLQIADRVRFHPPVSGQEKKEIFAEHDLLVLPSLTEISPNTALEAVAAGLPVLLTEETGLSTDLLTGIETADLLTVENIVQAVGRMRASYNTIASATTIKIGERNWCTVASETIDIMSSMHKPIRNTQYAIRNT